MPKPRLRNRTSGLLGLIAVIAVVMAVYMRYRHAHVAWDQVGGMIGWSQSAIESRLGSPATVVAGDVPDYHGHKARPGSGAAVRTLVFRTWDGQFVAWLEASADGSFNCVRSTWVEKNLYY